MSRQNHTHRQSDEASNAVKTYESLLRVNIKTTVEMASAIKNMTVQGAYTYLKNVIDKKVNVPFGRHNDGVDLRTNAKISCVTEKKSAHVLIDLLKKAKSNADDQGLNSDNLVIEYIEVEAAPDRRKYSTYGSWSLAPCYVELWLNEPPEYVKGAKKMPKLKKYDEYKEQPREAANMERKMPRLERYDDYIKHSNKRKTMPVLKRFDK